MTAVCRFRDLSTDHDGWIIRPNNEASDNVFVNNLGIHRLGDSWEIHCKPSGNCHGGVLSDGSPTVFCNGKEIGRIGDPISCGSYVLTGSPDVFSN